MRQTVFACSLMIGLVCSQHVSAQSTISDRPFEMSAGGGLWAGLLPSYQLGTDAGGDVGLGDDMDQIGGIGDLRAVRRFLGTRTSFEANAFFAAASSHADGGSAGFDVLNPESGALTAIGAGSTRLDSDVEHYGIDLILRDTWRTSLGGLSAGCAFSYMAFDQQWDAQSLGTRLLREDLNTDFRGGKGFVGWDGCWRGRRTNIDLMFGWYDMDADYEFIGGSIAGSADDKLSTTARSIEAVLTTRGIVRGFDVGVTFAAKYISDMPQIVRDAGVPARLTTDEAVTLSATISILL